MINGMYLSTMGAMVQAARHENIANNLANANTGGFKPDWTVYRTVPAESLLQGEYRPEVDRILEQTGGGVWLERTYTDFSQGVTRETGNPLNAALEDTTPGTSSFFMVSPGEGEDVHYTRDGNFTVNAEGVLMTTTGAKVLSPEGGAITIPDGAQAMIGTDGSIVDALNGNAVLGQIGVKRTSELKEMTKVGDNLYTASANANLEAWQNGVLGGHVEDSSTNPIFEMVSMIEAQRTYETNMKFLTIQDETLGSSVRRIAAMA